MEKMKKVVFMKVMKTEIDRKNEKSGLHEGDEDQN